MSFLVPSSVTTTEITVKNSRFITTLFPCNSRPELKEKYRSLQQHHPKARHHCWAMIYGTPGDSSGYGFSDDGEPSGTAGKPIFTVLAHQNIGHCGVIVTRYFGGIKLGTGGMVKAYTEATKTGILQANLTTYTPTEKHTLTFPFSQENTVRHLAARFNALIVSLSYSHEVQATLELPPRERELLSAYLSENCPTIHWS